MRTANRWVIAIAGVFLQIALGAVYAWSVFRVPLSEEFGWSISQVTLTFTISIFVLGFAAFFGGLWMNRKGPRIVALTGAALYGLGVFLASFSAHKLWWLYLSYGFIGGLGLGYTAVAALEHPEVASLLIIDALAPVIEWHEKGLVPLGEKLTSDSRCRFLHADFFARAQSVEGFDPEQPGHLFHAVLLDIDHSPRHLLHPGNASLYEAKGLRALAAHLRPSGIFALWSDEPPDDKFLDALGAVFATARAHIVTFPNPLLEGSSESTVYVAAKAG